MALKTKQYDEKVAMLLEKAHSLLQMNVLKINPHTELYFLYKIITLIPLTS